MSATVFILAVLGLAACGAGQEGSVPNASPIVELDAGGPGFATYPWSVRGEGPDLHFESGSLDPMPRPLDEDANVESYPLSPGRIVVWAGPIGEWYESDNLILVLRGLPGSPRIESMGVWHWIDLEGSQHWLERVTGTMLLDEAGVDADGLLRVDVRLAEPLIRQSFEVQVGQDCASLRGWLADFESVH